MPYPKSICHVRWYAGALLAGVLLCYASAYGSGRYRIFVVHSYNPEYVWCQNISQGIVDSLQGLEVNIKTFYLDAKRRPDSFWLAHAGKEAFNQIRRFKPDVIITVDDAAQSYLTVPYLKNTKYQVVFCGVNAQPSAYGFPADNVSGVRERWHYREGFALLKRLFPSLTSVAFLVDDSESGHFVLDDLHEDLRDKGPFPLELAAVKSIRTFQEFKESVVEYDKTAGSLALGLYQTLIDADTGQVVPPEVVTAWLHGVVTKPTIGFADVAIEHGMLCGVLESGHEQGFLAGDMARAILTQGVKAGALPMRKNDKGIVLVNLCTAERLHVKIPYEIIEASGVVIK